MSLMNRRRSIGPSREPWETPVLIGYTCEDISSHLIKNHSKPSVTEKWWNKAKYPTWNSIRLEFVRKNSMKSPVKSFGYIKCYSSISPRPIKILCNSIKKNSQKICSWRRRPETILGFRKRPSFLSWSASLLFTSFRKILLNTERRLTGQ